MSKSKFLLIACICLMVQIVTAYDDDLDPVESSNVYEKVSIPDKFHYRNLDNQPTPMEQSSNPRSKQAQSHYSSASSALESNGGNNNVNSKSRGHHFSSGSDQSSEYSERPQRKEGRGGDLERRDSRVEGRTTERERETNQSPSGRIETSRGEGRGRVEARGEGQGLSSRPEGREGGHGRAEPRVTEGRDYGRIEAREDSESVLESTKQTSSSPLLSVAESQQQQQIVQMLPRVSLRHDGAQRECKKCGGFSLGAVGGCCKSCAKLGYNKGCWCRSCDCLCYDA